MTNVRTVRWGILSTARIGASNFLPSLRAAGGVAYAVASRSLDAARDFAAKNGVEHAVQGYEALLEDDAVDAVYISLPNGLHAEWTIAALRAGKAVLCEKPLASSVDEMRQILDVANETGQLLWEAFVFPFQPQTQRALELIAEGQIGEVREIRSVFQTTLRRPDDPRWDPDLAGGALNDVGCYCIHLATIVFGVAPTSGAGMMTWTESGVDETTQGLLEYPSGARLLFSCSFTLPDQTGGTIVGTEGVIRLSNPFHPRPGEFVELRRGNDVSREELWLPEPTFTEALRDINASLTGQAEPVHLAITDAMPTAVGMELIRKSRQ